MSQQSNEGAPIEPVTEEVVQPVEVVEEVENKETKEGDEPKEGAKGSYGDLEHKDIRRIKSLRRQRTEEREGRIAAEEASRKQQERNDALEARLAQIEKQGSTSSEPDPSQYDSDEKYIKDLAQWQAEQSWSQKQSEAQAEQAKASKAEADKRSQQTQYMRQVESVKQFLPDYDAKLEATAELYIPVGTNEVIQTMGPQVGTAVNYYLASNPDVLESLADYETNQDALAFQIQSIVPDAMKLARAGGKQNKNVSVATPAPAPQTHGNVGANKLDINDPALSSAERIKMLRERRVKSGRY